MKKILLSVMALFVAMATNAAIDLNDPTTYTSKVYDFVNDAALNGQSLTIGTTNLGTAYETGNAKQQVIYNCTAPEPLVGVFAFQGVAGSKGTRLVSGKGMQNYNATRSAAILGLMAGQIVVFVSSSGIDFTGGGTNEGTHTQESSDNLTYTVTMTSDGNLGFCIPKNQYLTKVTIYSEKKAGECTAPEAKVTGTAGKGRVITLTDADTSAKIYWAESKTAGFTEYTVPVTTFAEKIYAYADNGAKSDTIEFETGAGTLVKLNGVTANRIGDYSFTLTASQVGIVGNPTAQIAYTIGNGTEQTVASGATIENVDADLTAWAVVDGYTNSDTTSVKFVAPFKKGGQAYSADFITLGSDKAGFTPASETTETFDGIDGTFYYSSLNDIYLQSVQDGSGNYAWLYRTGKGNSNFKCQYAAAYMVFKNVKKGTVVDIYAGNDAATKAPIDAVVNGETYNYNSHYFVKATSDGNMAVKFSTGSMIMTVTEYAAPLATATFDDITLDGENTVKYFSNDDPMTNPVKTWTSGSYTLSTYTDDYGSYGTYYYSYAVSNKTTTSGKLHDYALESVCGGAKSGANYAVWYDNSYNGGDSIKLASAAKVSGVYVTNTTSVVDAILNGDDYDTTNPGFHDGDVLTLTFTGYKAGAETGKVDFKLAYAEDGTIYYAKDWKWVDLSALGEVEYVKNSMTSTKVNTYGPTTPTYFCLDDFGGVAPATDAEYATHSVVTAISNVDANATANRSGKYIINGCIVILNNNARYNIAGQQIK